VCTDSKVSFGSNETVFLSRLSDSLACTHQRHKTRQARQGAFKVPCSYDPYRRGWSARRVRRWDT
jgi:hypothetical protein